MSSTFRSESLFDVVFSHPAIDNHTHPLLKEEHRSAYTFDGLVTEAQGAAKTNAIHTLPFYRATAHLSRVFQCDPTWEAVKAKPGTSEDGLTASDRPRGPDKDAGRVLILRRCL